MTAPRHGLATAPLPVRWMVPVAKPAPAWSAVRALAGRVLLVIMLTVAGVVAPVLTATGR